MPQTQIPLIKGDKTGSETDYRDGLPINMYAVQKNILGAAGYMQNYSGIKFFSNPISLVISGPAEVTINDTEDYFCVFGAPNDTFTIDQITVTGGAKQTLTTVDNITYTLTVLTDTTPDDVVVYVPIYGVSFSSNKVGVIPTDGLIIDYVIDAINITNSVGVDPSRTNVATAQAIEGPFYYMDFNGTSSVLDSNLDVATNNNDELSFSMMFYNRGGHGDTFFTGVLFGESDSGSASGDILVGMNRDENIEIYNETGPDGVASVNSKDQWDHLIFTYKKNGDIKLYYNNTLQLTLACTTWNTQPTLPFGDGRHSFDEYYFGRMAKVRVFNRILTSLERTELYNEYLQLLS